MSYNSMADLNEKKINFTCPYHCLLMSQQLLANKHNRLRDSRLSLVWPSGGLGLVEDKTKKNHG